MTILHDNSGNGNDGYYGAFFPSVTAVTYQVTGLVAGDTTAAIGNVTESPGDFLVATNNFSDPSLFRNSYFMVTWLDFDPSAFSQYNVWFGPGFKGLQVFIDLDGKMIIVRYNGVTPLDNSISEAISISAGVHCFVFVYNSDLDQYSFYVDGALHGSPVAGSGQDFSDSYFGYAYLCGNQVDGSGSTVTTWDEFAFGPSAPSDSDVADLYAAAFDSFEAYEAQQLSWNPAAYYHFNDPADVTPPDPINSSPTETNPFVNRSNDGNEKALRKGRQVPGDAVNVAYFKSPELSPDQNVVVIDSSKVSQENIIPAITGDGQESMILPDGSLKKLYYANALGVLEDLSGNQLITEEYPVVSDTFRSNIDWTANSSAKYSVNDSLLYLHQSRHFHIDFAEQTTSLGIYDYHGKTIKVIYSDGRDYVDVNGVPRYRIRLVKAAMNMPSEYDQQAYRVFAYVDTDTEEDLYLLYSKVELDSDLVVGEHQIGFREILNPIPVLSYYPEESMVVDPTNRREKWYSSYPASLKDQVLGLTKQSVQGFKVVVPRKAVGDPRLFQLFRWRLNCDFSTTVKVDNIRKLGLIRVGAITTNGTPRSLTPYVFYNLQRSAYNTNGLTFINPRHETVGSSRTTHTYWHVNFDTTPIEEMNEFDMLIWSPQAATFDFYAYSAKIAHYVNNGGTLFIDTNDVTHFLGSYPTSAAVNPETGTPRSPGPRVNLSTKNKLTIGDNTHALINGAELLGGWKIGASEQKSLSWIQTLYNPGHAQCWMWHPLHDGFQAIVTLGSLPLTVNKRQGKGRIILSTFGHLFSCNALFNFSLHKIAAANRDPVVFQHANYEQYINSPVNAGAMKLVYNAALWALQGKILDTETETSYSTGWRVSTPWNSSWAINGDVLADDERQEFDFAHLPTDVSQGELVWQRKLSSSKCKQLIESVMTPQELAATVGYKRTFSIEVTNEQVEVPTIGLNGDSVPYAWTTAYSPPFTVPADTGPYAIREEEVKGNYEAGQYIVRSYPPKPYKVQAMGQYVATKNGLGSASVNWSASGTATETITITKDTPPSTTSTTSLVGIDWTNNSAQVIIPGGYKPYVGASVPRDAWIGQAFSYYPYNSWVHYGIVGRYELGSQGDVPAFLQEALNRFQFFGIFSLPSGTSLNVDGYYGPATQAGIRSFQQAMGAKYIDGVVDAETLSFVGGQVLRLSPLILKNTNNTDFTRFFGMAVSRMPVWNMADGDISTNFSKRSWMSAGPSVISENFFIHYDTHYNIYGITVTPFLEGSANTLNIYAYDVFHVGTNAEFANWNTNESLYSDLPIRAASGEPHFFPLWAPKFANAIAVTLVQDQASFGSSRMVGVRNIIAHAEMDSTIVVPGKTVTTHQTRTIDITATGHRDFDKTGIISLRVHPKYTGDGTLSKIHWDNVTTDNSFVRATITQDGLLELRPTSQTIEVTAGDPSHYVVALPVPNTGLYYHMRPNGTINPVPAHGMITKEDGVQLLARKDGSPYGLHASTGGTLFPAAVGSSNSQRHYVKIILKRLAVDNSVYVGFYDRKRKEWVEGPNGIPEISFIEYTTRGIDNMYIGVQSTYEVDSTSPLPPSTDALLPYRWAMPVYGLLTHQDSHISLESPSGGLGRDDYWPIPVVPGSFHRSLNVPPRSQLQLTGWIKNYQNDQVDLFYGLPEARDQGWSSQFGPPNFDIFDESPIVVSDTIIQVRQPPILMVQWPTGYDNPLADPLRPMFKVRVRPTIEDDWEEIPWNEIKDVNISTGEIYLKNALLSTDENLCSINYTSQRGNYDFKAINLNPFHTAGSSVVGVPIYVYLLPEYARDSQGNLITDSLLTRCLQFTLDADLFDPNKVQYDPTALQLGVVYISTIFNIDDLILVDTRERGGGAMDNLTSQQIVALEEEGASYWDLNYSTGGSYMKGGFVMIRLPRELQSVMDDQDIYATIVRNITSGVAFRLEDLDGNSWE